jgi:hypothetical protein
VKRNGDIASLFQKHAAKKAATAASSPPSNSNIDVVEDQCQELDRIIEEDVDHTPTPPPPALVYDINHIPHDPSERLPSKVILLMIKMQFIHYYKNLL